MTFSMLVTVHNRGPEAAKLHLLPQLCFRNTWSWRPNGHAHRLSADHGGIKIEQKCLRRLPAATATARRRCCFATTKPMYAGYYGQPDAPGFFKDAFHDYVIAGNKSAVNPAADRHQGGRAL